METMYIKTKKVWKDCHECTNNIQLLKSVSEINQYGNNVY